MFKDTTLNDIGASLENLEALVETLKRKQNTFKTFREICEENKRTGTKTFVDEVEAAKIIGCAASLLANKRHKGTGPHFFKVAGRIRYDLADLLDYIDSCKNSCTCKKA